MSTTTITKTDLVRAYLAAYYKAAADFRGGSVYFDPEQINARYGWEDVVFHAASGGVSELGSEIVSNCQLDDFGDFDETTTEDEFVDALIEHVEEHAPFSWLFVRDTCTYHGDDEPTVDEYLLYEDAPANFGDTEYAEAVEALTFVDGRAELADPDDDCIHSIEIVWSI